MAWIAGKSPIVFPGLGLELNPPAGFSIGTLSIQFYGVIIAAGLLLAVIYGLKRSQQFGLKEDDILDGVLWIVPLAIVCARLYYCFFSWDYYKNNPVEILYIWQGGIAIYGSVIGAVLGVVLFCFIKKVKLGAVLDLVALGFLIGQAIGRWGNFFNREAYGAVTDNFLRMGLMLSEDGTAAWTISFYHPTFFYESVWNIAGFAVLHFLSYKRQYDGQIALGYVFWYGLGRTFIEGLRTDSLMLGDFRVSQLLAAVSCFVAATALVVLAFRKHDPKRLFVNLQAEKEAAETAEETAEETVCEEESAS